MPKFIIVLKLIFVAAVMALINSSFAQPSFELADTSTARYQLGPITKKPQDDESAINISIDKKFNLHLTDGDNRGPERCAKTRTDTAIDVDGNILEVCRAFAKPTRLIDTKSITVLVSEGSYILTLVDENGNLYQICYDDNWVRIDCSEL